MLLGYEFNGSDAKEKMLGDMLELAPPHPCNLYRSIYEINFLPDNYKIPKRKNDFYDSPDGFLLVSERVKAFCQKNKYKGLEFIPLPNTEYYWLKSVNIIEYDKKNKYLKQEEYSKKCKDYRNVSCPTPVFLVQKKPLGDNFYRTDLSFGDDGKAPITCIGIETYKKLKKEKFTGIFVEEIHDQYDPKQLPDWEIYKKMDDPDFDFLTLLKEK